MGPSDLNYDSWAFSQRSSWDATPLHTHTHTHTPAHLHTHTPMPMDRCRLGDSTSQTQWGYISIYRAPAVCQALEPRR